MPERLVGSPTHVRLEPGFADWVVEVAFPAEVLARRAGITDADFERPTRDLHGGLADQVDAKLALRVLIPVHLITARDAERTGSGYR